MSISPQQKPIPTPKQAETLDILNRIYMARLMLYVVLALFVIGFLAFIAAMFITNGDGIAKTILGGIDTLLGVRLAQISKHLYPSREVSPSPRTQT